MGWSFLLLLSWFIYSIADNKWHNFPKYRRLIIFCVLLKSLFRRYSRLLSAPLSKGHIQIISNSKFSLRTSQDVSLQQVSTEHSLPFDRSFTNFNSFLLFQVQITNWHFSVNLTVMYRYRVYRFSALNGGNITWSYPLLFRFSAPFSWGFQEDIKKTKFSWVTNIFFHQIRRIYHVKC